ncbi:Protein of unknown function [Pyronema omphalodes CBS 100304]|uniref:Uncharacterized protein n=1 Tax=Pyronema omphalodes (strain CBS 100304) TaxID=1076935 RepID=U4L566_PYROM|nr:Protein of unknown function [Pyronema omphalodes CBS 100304]
MVPFSSDRSTLGTTKRFSNRPEWTDAKYGVSERGTRGGKSRVYIWHRTCATISCLWRLQLSSGVRLRGSEWYLFRATMVVLKAVRFAMPCELAVLGLYLPASGNQATLKMETFWSRIL